MGSTSLHSGEDGPRAQVLALVRARVSVRFRLTAEAFADRILTLDAVAAARPEELRSLIDRLVLDDLYLATACAGDDDDAWREVEKKHFAFVRDFAARFLRGSAAEDLAADVVADLWQHSKIGQFEGRSTLRTWLGAVVTRAALNAMAAQRLDRRHLSLAAEPQGAAVAQPESAGDGLTLAGFMRAAINRLDPESKLLLLFHYEQGLSLDQMTPLLGGSKATLSRRLKRIREDLRTTVERLATTTGGPAAAESLKGGISRAQAEFDLAALLGGASGTPSHVNREEARSG